MLGYTHVADQELMVAKYLLWCSVTLGDEQAKKRGVQKSVRERAGPPTFECCIEMDDRQHWHIYDDVASATDDLLAGMSHAMHCIAHARFCMAAVTQETYGQGSRLSWLC